MDSTQLSLTECRRPRLQFSKLDKFQISENRWYSPKLLEIQLDSYLRDFLQVGLKIDERSNSGLQAAFQSVFPIISFSGNAELHFVQYRLSH